MEIQNLSYFRKELMGVAMLSVMIFHVVGNHNDNLALSVAQCGEFGVDMFLFLSGMGLWYAWNKNPSLSYFYKRRIVRIYPAWLIVTGIIYIPRVISGSMSIGMLIGEWTIGLGFWQSGDLSFWFIPAIMVFYLCAPFYMRLIRRFPTYHWLPLFFVCLCLVIEYWASLHQHLGYLGVFLTRIPVFLLGVNCGQWSKEQRQIEQGALPLLLLCFAASAFIGIGCKSGLFDGCPLSIVHLAYVPLSFTSMLLLCRLMRCLPSWVLWPLSLLGTISLEFYLIHQQFVLKYLYDISLNYATKALLTLLISTSAAWLLHQLIALLEKRNNGVESKIK